MNLRFGSASSGDEDESTMTEDRTIYSRHTKGQVDRADNSVLREENERISFENNALKEALNTILCSACGGPSRADSNLHKLLTDNANLKQEYIQLSKMMAKYTGILPLLQVDSPFTRTIPSSVMNNQQTDGRIFGIQTNFAESSVIMNNYYNNVQQHAGIFGIQEQVMESDNSNEGVVMDKGPSPLAELMKLLA